MKCPRCGAPIYENEHVCSYCSYIIEETENEESNFKSNQELENKTIDIQNVSNEVVLDDASVNMPLTKIILTIGIYILCTSIISSFVQLIIAGIYKLSTGITNEMLDPTNPLYNELVYNDYTAVVSAWSNFVMYFILTVSLGIFTYKFFINDFKRAAKTPAKSLRQIFIGSLVFLGIGLLSSIVVSVILALLAEVGVVRESLISGDSENQEIIIKMVKYGGIISVITFFAVVAMGPLVEEIVFRKALFSLFKNKNRVAIFISAAIFGAIHVTSAILMYLLMILQSAEGIGFDNILVEMVYFISYFASGIALSAIYQYTERNIFIVAVIHILNNLLSVIQIFLIL